MPGGTGVAPKLPEQRRNRVAPQRGEWIELPRRGVGPPPADPDWDSRTVQAWTACGWNDPASTQWVESDIDAVFGLAELVQSGFVKNAAEIRLRAAELGLGAKGRQDRRWRVVEVEEEAEPKKPVKSRRRNLNVVA